MNGTDIIVGVVVSFVLLIMLLGIIGIAWLWISEFKAMWRRHQSRKIHPKCAGRR